MPKRQSTRRITTEKVQGDDSFIVVKEPTYADEKEFRKLTDSLDKDESDNEKRQSLFAQFLSEHIVDWNWVDDNGKPFPIPKDDPSVIDLLIASEVMTLVNALLGPTEEELKN